MTNEKWPTDPSSPLSGSVPTHPLLERLPPLQGRLPALCLGHYPTPTHLLAQLSESLGCQVWIKRDDLTSALYGGNKVRKLDLLLADALSQSRHSVWTLGGNASHHILATARFSKRLGLGACAATFPQPKTPHATRVRSLLKDPELGLRLYTARCLAELPVTISRLLWRETRLTGQLPYRIPAGGSSPLGVLGYVNAALELAQGIRAGDLPNPDILVVALGSGGTAAGLLLGLEMAGIACELHAVRVTHGGVANAVQVLQLAWGAARLLQHLGVPARELRAFGTSGSSWPALGRPNRQVRLQVVKKQLGRGYGHPTTQAVQAQHRASQQEGLTLDPTYTAKAMAHVLETPSSRSTKRTSSPGGSPTRDLVVLYWHTLHLHTPNQRFEKSTFPSKK